MFRLEWGLFQQTGWVVAVPTMPSKKAGVQAPEEAEWEHGIQLWKPAEEPLAPAGTARVVNKAWVERKNHRRNSKTRARRLFEKPPHGNTYK